MLEWNRKQKANSRFLFYKLVDEPWNDQDSINCFMLPWLLQQVFVEDGSYNSCYSAFRRQLDFDDSWGGGGTNSPIVTGINCI